MGDRLGRAGQDDHDRQPVQRGIGDAGEMCGHDDGGKDRQVLDAVRMGTQGAQIPVGTLRAVAAPVLRHRIVTNFSAQAEGVTSDAIVSRLLESTKVGGSVGAGLPGLSQG